MRKNRGRNSTITREQELAKVGAVGAERLGRGVRRVEHDRTTRGQHLGAERTAHIDRQAERANVGPFTLRRRASETTDALQELDAPRVARRARVEDVVRRPCEADGIVARGDALRPRLRATRRLIILRARRHIRDLQQQQQARHLGVSLYRSNRRHSRRHTYVSSFGEQLVVPGDERTSISHRDRCTRRHERQYHEHGT